jgi:hypothetical protein
VLDVQADKFLVTHLLKNTIVLPSDMALAMVNVCLDPVRLSQHQANTFFR